MNAMALRFKWGDQRLHSEVLTPSSPAFTVGSAAGVDFPCADVAGAERFTLVPAGDTGTIRFARGMAGAVWRGEEERPLKAVIASGEAVPDGDGFAVTLGALGPTDQWPTSTSSNSNLPSAFVFVVRVGPLE